MMISFTVHADQFHSKLSVSQYMISFTVQDQFHSTWSVSQYMISFTVQDQFHSTWWSVSQYMMISFTVHADQFHSTWWSVSQYMLISFTVHDEQFHNTRSKMLEDIPCNGYWSKCSI